MSIYTVPRPENERVRNYCPRDKETKLVKEELNRVKSQTEVVPLVIGGQRITDRPTENVVCPHDHNHVLAKVAQANAEDVNRAITSSLEAREAGAGLPWQERAGVFLKAAELLAGPWRDRMNAATMLGQSKTIYQAEIDAACELVDFFKFNAYFAAEIYQQQPMHSPAGMWNKTEVRGLEGFVFAVAPFNFSSISVNLAAAPALMGCSVLWKPSPTSALSSWIGMQILEEAGLPPGIIQFINGDAKMIGEQCLAHREFAGLHFTGSTKTFNHLWKEVGTRIDTYKHYPRIVGETGGKDFVFAHPSADPETLSTALLRGAFEYQGQKCSAASRAYIPKSLWPKVKAKLTADMSTIAMGDVEDFQNFVGAVIDERSFTKIKSYIDGAKEASDAEVIAGGETDSSKGWFVSPTLIETSNPNYSSLVEEIFGPVLTVYPYDDDKLEETLDLCDSSTDYALTGAIFARERGDIHHLTERLRYAAGNFYVNDKPTGAVVGQQPFGGSRGSGTNDKAGSPFNLLRWTSHRTIKENYVPPTEYKYPHMED